MAVLQDVTKLEAEIAALKAQLASKNQLSAKVTEKGGISVYGLNARFPVTLYKNQWERLFDFVPQLKAVIEAGVKAGTVSLGKNAEG